MSTYNDKTLKNVADAVMNVMREELKGNQHKIDKNKNNKIDAQDFKILRGEKKPPFEGGKEKPETVTDKSGAQHTPMSRAKDLARRNINQEETEQVDEASSPVWDYKNSATEKKTGATTRTGHDVRKTNTGTVYTKRAPAEKSEDQAPTVSKKSKSDLMSDEEFKKKHGMSRKNYERMKSGVKIGESFSEMIDAYDEYGLAITSVILEEKESKKKCMHEEDETCENCEKEMKEDFEYIDESGEMGPVKEKRQTVTVRHKTSGKELSIINNPHYIKQYASMGYHVVKEEFDLDQYSLEEIEEFMMSEDFEQLDEISKQTLGSYIKKASHDVAAKGAATRQFANDARQAEKEGNYTERRKKEAMADKTFKKSWKRREGMAKAVDRLTKEEAEQLDELSKKTLGSYVKAAAKDAEDAGRAQEYYGHKNDYKRGEKRQKGVERAINRLTKEDAEHIEETNDDRDWGSMSKRQFKRAELEHELRHEVAPKRRYPSSAPQSKIYHKVPFAQKDEAKAEGMRFDGDKKKWYHTDSSKSGTSKFQKEEFELDERSLTEPEMQKREDYVKGMKKKLSGFKSRYGDRAKSVMYATATRMAKEDK